MLSLFDYYIRTNEKNVLIFYKGPVTAVILAEISSDIRNKFSEDAKTSRKVFSVFMELAQNVLYYSAERVSFNGRKDSVGTILLTEDEDSYIFSCGNLIETNYLNELLDNIETINSMDMEQLREYRRSQRGRPSSEKSKGAGIGLIHVAIVSANPLDIEFREVADGNSFFSITAKVDKDKM